MRSSGVFIRESLIEPLNLNFVLTLLPFTTSSMDLLVVGSNRKALPMLPIWGDPAISSPYFGINPFFFVDIPLQFSRVERLNLLIYLGSDDYDLTVSPSEHPT